MIAVCYAENSMVETGDPMEEQAVAYFSYLLRMWRTGEKSAWRASLEDPQTGKRVGFGSLETLFAFLLQRTYPAPGSNQEDSFRAKGE